MVLEELKKKEPMEPQDAIARQAMQVLLLEARKIKIRLRTKSGDAPGPGRYTCPCWQTVLLHAILPGSSK